MTQQLKPGWIVCPNCRGHGRHYRIDEGRADCPRCGGEGQVPKPPGEFRNVGVSFQAMLAPDGTPFLNRVTLQSTPKGVEIVGNGTLSHPLAVKLSDTYADAPEMARLLRVVASFLPEAYGSKEMYKMELPFDVICEISALVAKLPEEGKP